MVGSPGRRRPGTGPGPCRGPRPLPLTGEEFVERPVPPPRPHRPQRLGHTDRPAEDRWREQVRCGWHPGRRRPPRSGPPPVGDRGRTAGTRAGSRTSRPSTGSSTSVPSTRSAPSAGTGAVSGLGDGGLPPPFGPRTAGRAVRRSGSSSWTTNRPQQGGRGERAHQPAGGRPGAAPERSGRTRTGAPARDARGAVDAGAEHGRSAGGRGRRRTVPSPPRGAQPTSWVRRA